MSRLQDNCPAELSIKPTSDLLPPSSRPVRPSKSTVIPPRVLHLPRHADLAIQVSIHQTPRSLRRSLDLIFPSLNSASVSAPSSAPSPAILAIPTFQPTACPILSWTPEAAAEKDKLLLTFVEWAADLCAILDAQGHWADYTDPASGLPMRTAQGNSFYPDVEGAEILLRYPLVDIGGCRLLEHPVWGTKVYPGTIFSSAPPDAILSAISQISC